jgi:putative ABC transport system permease protein
LRRLLVGGQVAVATALLVCAALFVGTLASLDRVDPGFEPENLLAVEIGGFAAYRDELLSRVRDLPGVESAALTTVRPLTAYPGRRTLSVEGYPSSDPDLEPRALFRTVGPHYLETLGVPLVSGRMFDETDRMGSEPVALVNESMSARYWAGGDPVGRRVKLGAADSDNSWYTVVGVIGDVRQRSLETEAEPELMLPYLQENGPYGPRDMLVRVSERTPDPAASIGGVLRALDPAVPVDIRTMAEVAGSGLGERRARTILISGFAALTLALSMLGVYALVAFAVADRSREMGIRLAVGARSQTLIRMMLRESLGPALAGSVAGLAAAMGVGRMVEGFLWGVRPTEPLALLLAALVVLGSAAAAAYLPARRLARIEPARVLHYE